MPAGRRRHKWAITNKEGDFMVPRYIKTIFVGPKEARDILNWSCYLFMLNIGLQPAILFNKCLVYDMHKGDEIFEYFHLKRNEEDTYKRNFGNLGSKELAKINGGYLNGLSLKLTMYNRKKREQKINAYLNPLKHHITIDYCLSYVFRLSRAYDIIIRSEREPTLVKGDYVILSNPVKIKYS